jgi:hypothetical protein
MVIGTLLSACNDETALEPPAECFGPLAVTVVSGTPPQFTWTTPCAVARLVVVKPPSLDASQFAWDVRSDTPRILSPVRYGEVPRGATEAYGPDPLRPGDTHQVRVYNAAQLVIGSASFVP